ncbi:hypothetical protein LCGC14_1447780 [marine sediment metagenome]|uniref:Uncharacterized protein n=1 Tax=marine sediment metagenome TaxID=412755 RepID=A0A0F9MKJ5_9ZZZZ
MSPFPTQPVGLLGGLAKNLLTDLNWALPSQQAFPTTATGVIPSRTASAIWLCDETASPLIDKIVAHNLVASGAPLANRKCVGFFDGTDLNNKIGVEFSPDNIFKSFESATPSFLDVDGSTSVAILVIFRNTDFISGNRALCDKMDTNDGYNMFITGGGSLCVQGFKRPTSEVANLIAGVNDGAWHCGIGVIDRSASTLQVFADVPVSPSPTIALTLGTLVNTQGFQIGNDALTGFPATDVRAGQTMIAYVAVFLGTDAEGWAQSELDTFFTHGKQTTSPILPSYAHASVLQADADEESGFGTRIAPWSKDQFASGFDVGLSNATKISAYNTPTKKNFLIRTLQFENATWVKSASMTVVANDAESPDGSQTMRKLTASAATQTIHQDSVTTTAEAFTFAIYATRVGALDISFTMRIRRVDTSAILASAAFSATSDRKRFQLEATTIAGVDTRCEIEIPTSGEAIHVWESLLVPATDDRIIMPIRATTVIATVARTEFPITNAAGSTLLKSRRGEVEATFVIGVVGTGGVVDRLIFATSAGADELIMKLNTTPAPVVTIKDSGGVTKQTIIGALVDLTAEHKFRARWDSVSLIPGHSENADLFLDALRTAGVAATWTAGLNALTLFIGHDATFSNHMLGVMSRLRIFSKPQPD